MISNEADMDRIFATTRLAAVIAAWSNSGLFTTLSESGPCELSELPGDSRALKVTARMLANQALLVRHGELWALSTVGKNLLENGVLESGNLTRYFNDLGKLEDVLSDGGPVPDESGQRVGSSIGVREEDPEKTRKFMKMLYRRSADSARETARWIDTDADGPMRVLDLGGGHGRFARELAKRGHEATLFDLPLVVDIARDIHGEEIQYLTGDFFVDDLGGPYDVILASNIIHGLSPQENKKLVKRASQALAPGGRLVFRDLFIDDLGSGPKVAVFFALVMLMYTDEGDSYSLAQVQQWFDDAGLEMEAPVVFSTHALVWGRAN